MANLRMTIEYDDYSVTYDKEAATITVSDANRMKVYEIDEARQMAEDLAALVTYHQHFGSQEGSKLLDDFDENEEAIHLTEENISGILGILTEAGPAPEGEG